LHLGLANVRSFGDLPPPSLAPLDKPGYWNYLYAMNLIRRTLELDAGTDTRLTEMAAERGQDVAAVLAEAVALLDSVIEPAGPDIAEDRRRLDEFLRSGNAVPLTDAKAWVASWDTPEELSRPSPQKIG
jgi:predicted transcriptional regulator